MSVKVMSWVWENSQQEGGSLLVLLAMADFARDDGTCWPSVSTLAQKSRLKERQVFYVLSQLRSSGEIETVQVGGGRHKTTTYRVTMGNPAKKTGFQETLHSEPETLQPSAINPAPGRTPPIIEPLVRTIINKPARGQRRSLKVNFQHKEWGEEDLWLKEYLENEQKTFITPECKRLLTFDLGWWEALHDEVGGVLNLAFLRQEFFSIRRWLIENPDRAPKESDILRFIAHWMRRAARKLDVVNGKYSQRP